MANKLYEVYKRSSAGPPVPDSMTFDKRQEVGLTMNYHKVMEMLKDAEVKIDINQKLTILRAIKKFSFNHNFISKE